MVIYKATNKINGMAYVGQTIYDLDYRRKKHINAILHDKENYYFHNALRKYGAENFDWDVIEECDNEDELNRLEAYHIGFFDTYNNGYNLTKGGDGSVGFKHTEESKKKRSELMKGKYCGKNHPMFGKHHTEESKQKNSKSNKGRLPWNTGKKRPEMSGKKNPRAKPIILIHPDGKGEQFDYMTGACKKYDLDNGNLTMVAQGKRKQHKGYRCRYVH